MEILVSAPADLDAAAVDILKFVADRRIVLFRGQMGAGKTTLIKALCRQLGVIDDVSSPTYSIANEYHHNHGSLYHFDMFRLRDITEALDLGFHEYLASGEYCFIEWPEIVEELIPPDHVNVEISENAGNRLIKLSDGGRSTACM